MKIGVPTEIKTLENRVSVLPGGVEVLVQDGHEVVVQAGAGLGSGYLDEAYAEAGATLLDSAEAIFEQADMIVKVKEPLEPEYDLIRKDQIVFTYFHFAASEPLTRAMIRSGCTAIAYETIETANGHLPLLTPMSEVAGRMAVQQAAKYLEKECGGKGKLLGGVPGVEPAVVIILGGGVVGTNAAKIAAGMGADVTLLDISLDRLRYLDDVMPKNVKLVMSNPANVRSLAERADAILGCVLVPGGKAPKLVSRDMLGLMQPGTVLVDVAIDQGGAFETSRPTTHDEPVYEVDGILHYCVANMPGAVPVTSTRALTNATFPYLRKMANQGWLVLARTNAGFAMGLNVINGQVTYKAVAQAFDLPHTLLSDLL